jgi:hypothetical protein
MNNEQQPYIERYQPAKALIIYEGIGGTGKVLVKYAIAYYAALAMWNQALLKYTVLDLDPTGTRPLGKQFYNMGNVPPTHDLINQFEDRPEDFPGLADLGDLHALRRAAGPGHRLIYGAQEYRPLGKLAWLVQVWKHWPDYLRFLSRPLLALRSYEDHMRYMLDTGDGRGNGPQRSVAEGPVLEIESVSISGGTGSAQVEAHADLRHQICQQQWGLVEYEQRCNLILPEAIDQMDDRTKENAWLTMLELEDRYQVRRRQPRDYGTVCLDQVRFSWVEVTLYNRINAQEFTLDSRDKLLQVVAEVDRLKHMAGRISEEWHAQFVNYVSFPPGYFCSAGGAVVLKIETEGMKDEGEVQLSQELIQYLLREPQAETVKQAATTFANQWGLAHQLRRFDRTVEDQPIKPDRQSFDNVSRKELAGVTASHEHKFFVAVDPALVAQRDYQLRTFIQELDKALVEEVNRHGLRHAIGWLAQLAQSIQAEQGRVQVQIERGRADFANWQQQQPSPSLGQVVRNQYRQKLMGQYWEKVRLLLQERKLIVHQSLLELQLQVVTARQRRLSSCVQTLKNVLGDLTKRVNRVKNQRARTRPVCVVNLLDNLDQEAEPRLIRQEVRAKLQAATQGLHFDWDAKGDLTLFGDRERLEAGTESLRTEAGIKKLLGYARTFFEFQGLAVEDWLSQGQPSLEEWLAFFDKFAAPFVTINEAKHPKPKVIKILGSQRGEEGYFAKALDHGWTVVPSDDPLTVEVLVSWHHLNWRWLCQADSWERAHRRNGGQNGHVWAEWHQRTDGAGCQSDTINE